MITIQQATPKDIPLIQHLANVIWPASYSAVLTKEQIHYMLEMMYSSEALTIQMQEQHHRFLLGFDGDTAVGFASYSPITNSTAKNVFKLHKIYVLPNQQGKGIGKSMIAHIIGVIAPLGAVALELNVNRNNAAKIFYERLGFGVIREEDIDIGGGYSMNDYVMRKELTVQSG